MRRIGTSVDGCLVHVGRATHDGFEVLEVWESKEHYDRANAEIVFPLMRKLAGGQPRPRSSKQPKPSRCTGLSFRGGTS